MAIFSKSQLTIKELLDIDVDRVKRSGKLDVSLDTIFNVIKEESWFSKILSFLKRKPQMFYKVFKYKIKSDSGNSYTVFIEVSPGLTREKFLSNKIHVFCSCEDFKYRAAYLLNKRGNLFKNKAVEDHLGIALTVPPTKVITTPVCKHTYAALIHFKNNLRNLTLIP